MIVIAPLVPSAADRGSEAYADYAEYLNDGASRRPAALKLIRMTPARWRRSTRGAAPVTGYAVVFVRRGGRR
ncbi:hypothetical protein [Sphingomonas sp.]|uniref:hypothetical protein n=1 Tax=Sphingomonas sp. TaxID=28214 RepID=UPI003B009519